MATLLEMDADNLIKQGREMAGKLRDGAGEQVAQHEQQIKDALSKVVDFVNTKTKGKYTDQVNKAVGYVEHGVDVLASGHRAASAPSPGAPQAGAPTGQPAAPAEPAGGGSGQPARPPGTESPGGAASQSVPPTAGEPAGGAAGSSATGSAGTPTEGSSGAQDEPSTS